MRKAAVEAFLEEREKAQPKHMPPHGDIYNKTTIFKALWNSPFLCIPTA